MCERGRSGKMAESIAPEERGCCQPLLFSSYVAGNYITSRARKGRSSCAQHCGKFCFSLDISFTIRWLEHLREQTKNRNRSSLTFNSSCLAWFKPNRGYWMGGILHIWVDKKGDVRSPVDLHFPGKSPSQIEPFSGRQATKTSSSVFCDASFLKPMLRVTS